MTPPTAEQCRERLREIAQAWQQMRSRSGVVAHYGYQQLHHWFYCLVWVCGFERNDGEELDSYIKRAADPMQ